MKRRTFLGALGVILSPSLTHAARGPDAPALVEGTAPLEEYDDFDLQEYGNLYMQQARETIVTTRWNTFKDCTGRAT